jgi:hypothetical protein
MIKERATRTCSTVGLQTVFNGLEMKVLKLALDMERASWFVFIVFH